MDKTRAFSSVLALFWLAAFALALPLLKPYEWARLGSVCCLFIAAGAALSAKLARGFEGPQQPLLSCLLAGFTLLAAASIFWSEVLYISIVAFATFCLLPGSYMIARCVPDKDAFYRIIAGGGGLLMALLALWVPVQTIFFPDLLVYGQVRYPFANPNSYAALLMPGLFGFLGLGMAAGRKPSRIPAFAVSALCLVAIVMITGRGVILASLFFLVLYGWLVRDRLGYARKGLFVVLLAGVGAFVVPYLLARVNALSRLNGLFANLGEVVSGRTDIWRGTWHMIVDAPLAGRGIGTFFLYYPQYRLPSEAASAGLMTHNDPLQFWAEMGIAAPLLFYGILFVVLWRMVALVRNEKGRAGSVFPFAVGLFCGLGGIAAHAHISYDLQIASLLCVSGLALGIWANFAESREERTAARSLLPPLRPASAAFALVFIPLIGFLFVVQGVLMSEYYAGRAKALIVAGDINGFSRAVNVADHTGFGWNARPYLLAASIPLGVLEAGGALADRAGRATEAAALLDKAQAANPRLVAIYHYRARLYHLTDDPREKEMLEKALRINPQHLPSRMALADLYEAQGKQEEALEILKQGLSWPYPLNNPQAYYNRVIFLASLTGDEEAAATARRKIEMARRENAAIHRSDTLLFIAPEAAPW